MSQKVVKRSRRHTEEEEETVVKAKEENGKNGTNGLKDENNGLNGESPEIETNKRVIQTRSRSNTPMKKNVESVKNDQSQEESDINDSRSISPNIDNSVTDKSTEGLNGSHEKNKSGGDGEIHCDDDDKFKENEKEENVQLPEKEIENIVAEAEDEENIPELQYDENDVDVESEGSPSRCKTRRSQTRHISTPKTPKVPDGDSKVLYIPVERLPEDGGSERSTPRKGVASSVESNVDSDSQPDETVDLDNSDSFSSTSIDNISTKALAGGDATRNTDLTYPDSALFDDNSISSSPAMNPNRSLTETLRGLSSRRTIRPLNNDYRKRAIQNNFESKGDLYANYESVEKITPGTKRKNRSITPEEDVKRMRREGAGLFSYISSPILSHFRNKSSTPKLLSYEKKYAGYDEPPSKTELEIAGIDEHHKKWCSIM